MSFDWKLNLDTLVMICGLIYTFGGFGSSFKTQTKQIEKIARGMDKLTTAVNELRVRDKLPPINHD